MFGISSFEFLVILIVGVVVLGPEKLPKVMRMFTKVMSEFRRISTDLQRAVNTEIAYQEHEQLKKEAEQELFGNSTLEDSDKNTGNASSPELVSSENSNKDSAQTEETEVAAPQTADGAETKQEAEHV